MSASETKGTALIADAKTLLLDLLAVIPDGEKSAAFFAEDGVLELPFLPTRHQGHAAIKEFYNYVGGTLYFSRRTPKC